MPSLANQGAIALIASAMCLFHIGPAAAQDAKGQGRSSQKITVKITDDKVRTKFTVKKGEWLEFACDGKWRIWEGYSFTDAEGQYKKADAQGRWAALVAQVGQSQPFGYGDGLPVQAPASGEVVLWPNRPWPTPFDKKAEGALIVTIHVGDHLKANRDEALATLRRQTEELQADKEVQQCLAAINELRKTCGLKPVTLNTRLSIACQTHAKYLIANRGHPLTEGLKGHEEYEELKGYTLAGAKAGKSSAIHTVSPSLAGAFQTTFYHRLPFLKPQLTEVGIGYHHNGDDWSTCVDIYSSAEGNAYKAVVYCPEDQQRRIPVEFGHELPDPIPASHKGKPAGYPITVYFTQEQKISKVDIKVFDDKGNEVACHVSSPEAPALTTYPVYVQGNTICAIPMAPLARATTYRVELRCTVSGKALARTWQFSTEDVE